MKKKILIVSASVLILAIIVGMGMYAQGSKSTNSSATEQANNNRPEKCKKCPSQSKCAEGKEQTAQTESDCEKMCAEKKMKCEGMKEGDKSECTRDKKSCGEATKCAEQKDCQQSSTCEKKCEKKSN